MPKRKCHLSLERHVSETYRNSCDYNLCCRVQGTLPVPSVGAVAVAGSGPGARHESIAIDDCQKFVIIYAGKSTSVQRFLPGKFISPAV